MILFTLRCAADHQFEGWFRDNAAYDRQNRRGLIACPECGSNAVEKAPMAPRLGRSHKSSAEPVESSETTSEPSTAPATGSEPAPPTPDQLRRALQVLRRHIE
jgi:hypothetical protein